jgi:hypothetical protein
MPEEREEQVQDPDTMPVEPSADEPSADEPSADEPSADGPDDDDEGFTSAQTRAGSNLPNAAGHRGDGTHE